MKKQLILLFCILMLSDTFGQQYSGTNSTMQFFNSIEGSWEAMPDDTSFISVLDYQSNDSEHFIFVQNDLLSKDRMLFSHYEGTYFFNPSNSRIEFTTINKSEIHSGYCEVRGDTLLHFATVSNSSGAVLAYASAIVKNDSDSIAYYAVYSKDVEIPEIKFETPLVYFRKKSQPLQD